MRLSKGLPKVRTNMLLVDFNGQLCVWLEFNRTIWANGWSYQNTRGFIWLICYVRQLGLTCGEHKLFISMIIFDGLENRSFGQKIHVRHKDIYSTVLRIVVGILCIVCTIYTVLLQLCGVYFYVLQYVCIVNVIHCINKTHQAYQIRTW